MPSKLTTIIKKRNWFIRNLLTSNDASIRLTIVFTLLVVFIVGFSLRLAWIIESSDFNYVTHTKNILNVGNDRKPLLDRRGKVLAGDIKTHGLAIDPKRFRLVGQNSEEITSQIQQVFPNIDADNLAKKLNGRNRLFYVKRRVTPMQQNAINEIAIAGMQWIPERSRLYTYGSVFSGVIGYTNVDNKGIAGIEKGYESTIAGKGGSVSLTLDTRYQIILRKALLKGKKDTSAKFAIGIIMSAVGGDILAMVSLPDGDPHFPDKITDKQHFNYAAQRYEMGSTFKIFNTALALENGITPETTFDVQKKILVAEFEIADHFAPKKYLSTEDILVYSSNAGSVQIALKMGLERQKKLLSNLGMLDPTGVHLPELAVPKYPYIWGNPEVATISYGYGIAVTPVHLAAGVAAIVNGGIYYPPKLILESKVPLNSIRRVVSSRTSAVVRGLLRRVVVEGTGKRASVQGLAIGGKTGTAEKISPTGGYSKDKLLSSFVAAYPVNDPAIVVLVMLDEPVSNSGKPLSGGLAAAPIVKDVISNLVSIVAVEKWPKIGNETNIEKNNKVISLSNNILFSNN